MSMKILIIDDDIDVLTAYGALLKSRNFRVETAVNTRVGKPLIEQFKPDLIILDVMMEQADEGFVFAQELLDEKVRIPVIITSSIARAGHEVFDMSIPTVKAMLQKPVNLIELVELVEKILKGPVK